MKENGYFSVDQCSDGKTYFKLKTNVDIWNQIKMNKEKL